MDAQGETTRERLRKKIETKRSERIGSESANTETTADTSTRKNLSRLVEAELRKMFRDSTDIMKIAQPLIENPMSVLESPSEGMPRTTPADRDAIESLLKFARGVEDNGEGPPPQ